MEKTKQPRDSQAIHPAKMLGKCWDLNGKNGGESRI
jgi:hypothetical protein